MTSNGYCPNKLIYLGDNTENRKAILVSVPNEFTDAVLETIELGATAFEDEYHQVAAACGAEFVDVNGIKIVGQAGGNKIPSNHCGTLRDA